MSNCYYCDRGPRQGAEIAKHNGVPMCYGNPGACLERYVPMPLAEKRLDKAPPLAEALTEALAEAKRAKKPRSTRPDFLYMGGSNGTIYMASWRLGGCIFCGKTERGLPSNKMAHGACYRAATPRAQEEAKRYIAEEADYE